MTSASKCIAWEIGNSECHLTTSNPGRCFFCDGRRPSAPDAGSRISVEVQIRNYQIDHSRTVGHTYMHACMQHALHTMHTCIQCIHAYLHTCIHTNKQTSNTIRTIQYIQCIQYIYSYTLTIYSIYSTQPFLNFRHLRPEPRPAFAVAMGRHIALPLGKRLVLEDPGSSFSLVVF